LQVLRLKDLVVSPVALCGMFRKPKRRAESGQSARLSFGEAENVPTPYDFCNDMI
jgi:hypothetical protein